MSSGSYSSGTNEFRDEISSVLVAALSGGLTYYASGFTDYSFHLCPIFRLEGNLSGSTNDSDSDPFGNDSAEVTDIYSGDDGGDSDN